MAKARKPLDEREEELKNLEAELAVATFDELKAVLVEASYELRKAHGMEAARVLDPVCACAEAGRRGGGSPLLRTTFKGRPKGVDKGESKGAVKPLESRDQNLEEDPPSPPQSRGDRAKPPMDVPIPPALGRLADCPR